MFNYSLKILHLLGLTMFLGSIFGQIVTSVLGGEPGVTPDFINAREHILKATQWLTLPGLGLALLSGLGLMWWNYKMLPPRWLQVHALLAAVLLMLALSVVVPAAQQTLTLAQAARNSSHTVSVVDIARAKRTEDVAGGVNVLLTLIIVAVGVVRPALENP